VQDAAVEVGLEAPNSAAGNPGDLTAIQLTGVYNATGEMLVKRRVWRALLAEHSFVTVPGVAGYDLRADFGRPVPQTEWDRSTLYPLNGPSTPQQWQALRSSLNTTAMRSTFRFEGNQIVLWPTPTTATTVAYNYISKWWVRDNAGQPKAKATNDSDYAIFDDRLMINGVKLRFFQAKGFDTTAFAADFQSVLDDAMSQDSSAPILSISGPRASSRLLSTDNLPDTGYGT